KLREELAIAQGKLDAYQRDHGVLGVDEDRLDVENVRLQEMSSQLVKAQAALVEAETRAEARSSTELADLMSNPLLQSLKSELARAEAKLADLSQRVDRNHPQYRSAAAEVAALKAQLDTEMGAARSSLLRSAELARQQVREIEAALEAQKERIIALRQGRDELSVLQRDVESARATYAAALQQANRTRLESRVDRTNIAILNPATVPTAPASPRIALNIVLAFFVSALCAAGWILYGELMRPRVRSRDDLEAIADLPVLAELPPAPRQAHPIGSRAKLPVRRIACRPRATWSGTTMSFAIEPARIGSRVPPRLRIGDLLVAAGALRPIDVQRIVASQRLSSKRFGEIALEMKLITQAQLSSALAKQIGYPYVEYGRSQLAHSLAAAYEPFCAYAEALRTLRSQLLMRWFGREQRALAVTSTRRDATCNTVAANLAIVFAQLGESTLLIDGNLRDPQQHRLFGLGACNGLTDLVGERCEVEE